MLRYSFQSTKNLAGGMFIATLTLGAGLVSAAEIPENIGVQRPRNEIELDLSLARLQEWIAAEDLDPEEARDAIAQWSTEHEAELQVVREQRRVRHQALKRDIAAFSIPLEEPHFESMEKREFVDAVEAYFQQGWNDCSSEAETGGDPEKARDNFSRWMEQPSQKRLKSLQQIARDQLFLANSSRPSRSPAPVLSEAEMAQLDPEQRIHEEIYARILALFATPLAAGEELRDRMGQIQEYQSQKLQEIAAIRKQRQALRAANRARVLEQELARSNTPH